jgi:site-specific recombinase XerD
MPKGLRHAFAIACLDKGLPLNMVQKWLGHSSIETTAIYANAVGKEERKLAAKLWQ